MRNRSSGATVSIVIGLLFITVGVILAGNIFLDWDIELFFRGWWTLFIIVPCVISIANEGFKPFNSFGLAVGLLFLLSQQGLLGQVSVVKLIFPMLLLAIGFAILFRNYFSRRKFVKFTAGTNYKSTTTVLGSEQIVVSNEVFSGADITCVLGGVDYDLRTAKFESDTVLNITIVLGGVTIRVPSGIKINTNDVPILGGITNKAPQNTEENAFTLFINATTVLGGVEIV